MIVSNEEILCPVQEFSSMYGNISANKFQLHEIRMITNALLNLIKKNYYKMRYFDNLTPNMIDIITCNGNAMIRVNTECKPYILFPLPEQIKTSPLLKSIFQLGIIVYSLQCNITKYSNGVFYDLMEYSRSLSKSTLPETVIYRNVDPKTLQIIYGVMCFIEACTGYFGGNIKAIQKIEQLENHIFLLNITIPMVIVKQSKVGYGNTMTKGLSKFLFCEGGQGYIFFRAKAKLANNPNRWIPYYLKKYSKGGFTSDWEQADKFNKREIESNKFLAALNSPFLQIAFHSKYKVRVNINECPKSRIYIEYINGVTLQCYTTTLTSSSYRSKIPEKTIRSLFFDIATVLRDMHNKGIMFRDLNSKNVMVYFNSNKELKPMLIDFGTVILAEQGKTYIGVLFYTAPEMNQHQITPYDSKVDVFSFGRLLYFCLTGFESPMHNGLIINASDGVSAELINLIERCCMMDKEKRMPSFNEILKHPFFTQKESTYLMIDSMIKLNDRTPTYGDHILTVSKLAQIGLKTNEIL